MAIVHSKVCGEQNIRQGKDLSNCNVDSISRWQQFTTTIPKTMPKEKLPSTAFPIYVSRDVKSVYIRLYIYKETKKSIFFILNLTLLSNFDICIT
jgi:hypothetical protein